MRLGATQVHKALDDSESGSIHEDVGFDVGLAWCRGEHDFRLVQTYGQTKFCAGVSEVVHDFLRFLNSVSDKIGIICVQQFSDQRLRHQCFRIHPTQIEDFAGGAEPDVYPCVTVMESIPQHCGQVD